jgi:transposase InsO family protein
VFSRYVWSVPLKDKTGASVTTALKTLFKSRQPLTLQSDKGTEFLNKTVQRYLKTQGVSFHTTHNPDIKGAIIERFNRKLKTRMYRYFTKITHTAAWMSWISLCEITTILFISL